MKRIGWIASSKKETDKGAFISAVSLLEKYVDEKRYDIVGVVFQRIYEDALGKGYQPNEVSIAVDEHLT